MDSVSFNIDQDTISYEVNWLGIETVKVNGNKVSKKLSLPGIKHKIYLNAFGTKETFYIKSKQSFSSGQIRVQLFHNDILIDERVLEFDFPIQKEDIKNPENSTLMTGMMFVFFSIIFDWPKFFLFIGLICVISSLFSKKDSTHTNDTNSGVND